jgi:hypothetical protein
VYFSGVTDSLSNNDSYSKKETDDELVEPPKKIILKRQGHQKSQSTIIDKKADTKHKVEIVDDRDIILENCNKLSQEKGYKITQTLLGFSH